VPAEPGLSDLLAQGGDLPFYLAPTAAPNLMLLPRGKAENNSGALFLGPNCDQLLARARNEFDCVIVDSIPVFAADDTTSLAPKLDGVLFVVRDSFTSADGPGPQPDQCPSPRL
jgi:Mrp family chromosome partitioning ATPase